MKGNLKIIGSNNDIMPLGEEYDAAELIENKLIVNCRGIDSTTTEPV